MELTRDVLISACSDDGRDAAIVINQGLEPVAGAGQPVKPAIFAGGVYQADTRWELGGEEPTQTQVVTIDGIASQANRLEAALRDAADTLRLSEIVLDLSGVGTLPPHLPTRISSLEMPHRQADAYLRDALVETTPLEQTDVGRELFAATGDNPAALVEWFPQSLLFGFWQSHLGKKRSQAKLARSWVSEIIGWKPGTLETRQAGIKGDPLNLSTTEVVQYDENLVRDWDLASASDGSGGGKQSGRKKEKLSEIGHGQVPFGGTGAPPSAISFRTITQTASVSFASLRRVSLGDARRSAAARSYLVALGLAAHCRAFGRPFSLRSDCDLVCPPGGVVWTWVGESGRETLESMTIEQADELLTQCRDDAVAAGLPVGERRIIETTPSSALVKSIRSTWPEDV